MPLRPCCRRQGVIVRFSRDIQLIYNFTKGRWKRIGNFRSFHSGIDNVTEAQRQARLEENGWEPWPDRKSKTMSEADQVDARNIVMGNLKATLEAHRTANRIHKVTMSHTWKSLDFRQLDLPGQPPEPQVKNDEAFPTRTQPPKHQAPLDKNDEASPTKTDEEVPKMRHLRFATKFGEKNARLNGSKTNLHNEGYLIRNLKPINQWKLTEKPNTLKSAEWESPWLSFVRFPGVYGPSRLCQEIIAYERYMRLKLSEVEASKDIREKVELISKTAIPEATIDLIGSYSNSLATPTSDMDFRLSLPQYEKDPLERGPSPGRPRARKATIKHLKLLREAFTASELFEEANLINASIPIIKVVHARTKIAVDIQVSSSEIPQQLYKETYLAEYPNLRPLYILLRSALQIRGLGTVFDGGLGSYTVLIMIVYALKICPPSITMADVGSQLLYILNLYGDANLYLDGFSLDPPSKFPKQRKSAARAVVEGRSNAVSQGIKSIGKIDEGKPYLLCLQDPADPLNDLGRRSYAIKLVQQLFRWASMEITKSLHNMESSPDVAHRVMWKGILFPLVGANYKEFESRRVKRNDQDSALLPQHLDNALLVRKLGSKPFHLKILQRHVEAVRQQASSSSSSSPPPLKAAEKGDEKLKAEKEDEEKPKPRMIRRMPLHARPQFEFRPLALDPYVPDRRENVRKGENIHIDEESYNW